MPYDFVSLEREVDFFDAVPLGAGAKLRFRTRRPTTEQDEIGFRHDHRRFFAVAVAAVDFTFTRGLLALVLFSFLTFLPVEPVFAFDRSAGAGAGVVITAASDP